MAMSDVSPASRLRWLAAGLLSTVFLLSAGQGMYMSGKAWLAQHLLWSAWQESGTGTNKMKPWPWADVHPVGLLEVPELGIRQVVLNDHSGESLAFGPGLAIGNGALMLAGHRDSHFAFLRRLKTGDRLRWRASGKAAREFRVDSFEVIDTRLREEVVPPAGTLLLVTCFPFDALTAGGPLRYVVVASEILNI